MNAATEFDLGPLTWVKGEIDAALERAGEAVAQFRESGDPTKLKFCRTHVHQVHGALAIVGLDGVTQVTEALEGLLSAIEEGKSSASPPVMAAVEQTLAGIRQYLDDLMAGEPNQPLRLLPVYRALGDSLGAGRLRPSDLFFPDLTIRPPKRIDAPVRLAPEAFRQTLKSERMRFQKGLLAWLRNPPGSPVASQGLQQMQGALKKIEETQETPAARSFWWVSQGFLDALADRGVAAEQDAKQLCARIDLQIRRLLEGSRNVAERLMRDALYYVGQARAEGEGLAGEISRKFQLEGLIPQEEQAALGIPEESALRRLREVIVAAEEFWGKFCAGSAAALTGFAEQAKNCAQITAGIGHTDLKRLGQGLAAIASWLTDDPRRQSESVSMEVATAILLLMNAQENFKRLGTDFAQQVDLMVARLHGCISGMPAAGDEDIPLLDEMSRRAQEKLLITQVAREIQTNLALIEQALDAFFREPAQGLDAAALEGPIKQIGGALAILGHDTAMLTLNACGQEIRRFGAKDYVPSQEDFEQVAQQLSTLGFFVDALQTGTTDYDRFVRKLRGEEESVETEEPIEAEAAQSTVEAELEEKKESTQALIAALNETPENEQLKNELKQNLQALQADADLVADHALGETAKAALSALEGGGASSEELAATLTTLKPQVSEAPQPSAETLKLAQASHEEIDAELLEIFLEEAHEVLANISEELEKLRAQPHDVDTLTNIRRGTHTLKGSGRMVGLKDFGEVAWEVEQTLNIWLRQEVDVNEDVLKLIALAHSVFGVWVDELAANTGNAPDASEVVAMATALRGSGEPPLPAITPEAVPQVGLATSKAALDSDEDMPAHLAATVVGIGPMFDQPADEDTQASAAPAEEMSLDIEFSLDIPTSQDEPSEPPVEVIEEPEAVAEEAIPELEAKAVAAIEEVEFAELEVMPEAEAPAEEAQLVAEELVQPAHELDSPEVPATVEAVEISSLEEVGETSQAGEVEFSFDLGELSTAAEQPQEPSENIVPSASGVEIVELPMPSEDEPAPSLSIEIEALAAEALPVEELSLPEPLAAELTPSDEVLPAEEPVVDSLDLSTTEEIELPAAPGADFAEAEPAGLAVEPALQAESPVAEAAVSLTLYDIFLEEARQHLDTLQASYDELNANPAAPTTFAMTRAAHTLGGIAATVGLMPINKLAIGLEHALLRRDNSAQPDSIAGLEIVRQTILALEDMFTGLGQQIAPEEQLVLQDALEEIFQLAAPEIVEGLPLGDEPQPSSETAAQVEAEQAAPLLDAQVETVALTATRLSDMPQLQDELDDQLLPIFLEEAQDLVQGFAQELNNWRQNPADQNPPRALARLLHTFKGGARMAGAMNLGELTHTLETSLEEALRTGSLSLALLEHIESGCDTLTQIIERLQAGELPSLPQFQEVQQQLEPEVVAVPLESLDRVADAVAEPAAAPVEAQAAQPVAAGETEAAAQRAMLRVRADLVDRLVNEAGELSIARARIEGEMLSLKSSLLDLTENVIRLRRQLREIEIQAETQIQARVAQSHEGGGEFDPLELDRFTRFQELTRFMAESVNDVATVQQNLLKNLDDANAALIAQSRMNRSLQQDLMGIRMEPFGNQGQRLYRIARQTAKEVGKRVDLDIRGGQVEFDRSVLDKIMAPIEHMLRNAISHGIEERDARQAAGKSEIGEVVLSLSQEGNEIVVAMSDDGRGLDVTKIRARAEKMGLLAPGEEADQARLYDFIFQPGFSTAVEVTQISGRGIGMDVVKSEITSLGGRIEIISTAGKGTTFRLYLPLTLAVTQTLLVRAAGVVYAVPSTMIEQVLELKESALADIRNRGEAVWLEHRYPFSFLPHLLGDLKALPETRRRYWVLLLRSGTQRVSVLVDELAGNREVVVKNIGAQLSRVVGIAGATVLGDGSVVLILNPVALASRQPTVSVQALVSEGAEIGADGADVPAEPVALPATTLPTVMVVDDSLTVRKITGRLLAREGYQVITAKDGVDALEHLVETIPDVMLSDIEMPRMDGFDLVRNVRADERLKNLPIIMITSRTADKHRNYALEIGANEYLGKPYDEDTLLGLISGFVKSKRGR